MTLNNRAVILLIDDNPDDLYLAKKAIFKANPEYIVEVASDGLNALESLKQTIKPSLIFLDLKMPALDGIEVLRMIRSNHNTRFVPVVVLTSSRMEEDILASYNAGASSFMVKSNDYSVFSQQIKTAIHYWVQMNIVPN
jgi:CheY-like chemotaxis protein